jgi:hypothetical protein
MQPILLTHPCSLAISINEQSQEWHDDNRSDLGGTCNASRVVIVVAKAEFDEFARGEKEERKK